MGPRWIGTAMALVLAVGCGPDGSGTSSEATGAEAAPSSTESVWSMDLIRTLPGGREAYLESIEANWASARDLARARGAVLSYVALAAAPDSARGWDVLLMTEYADSAAYADREEIFQEIFASPEFVPLELDRPSSELRSFLVGDVPLETVARSP